MNRLRKILDPIGSFDASRRSRTRLVTALLVTNILGTLFFVFIGRRFVDVSLRGPYVGALVTYMIVNAIGLVVVLKKGRDAFVGLPILLLGSLIVTAGARVVGDVGSMAICINVITITVVALLYGAGAAGVVAAASVFAPLVLIALERAELIQHTGFPHVNTAVFFLGISILFGLVAMIGGSMSALVKRREREIAKLQVERHFGTIVEAKDKEIAARSEALESIDAVGSILVSITDVNLMLQKTLRLLVSNVGGGRASIMLPDESGKHLKIEAALNLPEGAWLESVPFGAGIAGMVAQEREGILIPDMDRAPASLRNARMGQDLGGSFMSVPLLFQDRVLGVINVSEERGGKHFGQDDFAFLKTLAYHIAVTLENAKSYRSLSTAYQGTISALANAVESKDTYTRGHSDRVTKYAVDLAKAVGLEEEVTKHIRNAGILHDIGKIGVPESILTKPSQLTDVEFGVMKQHPVLGEKIVHGVSFLEPAKAMIRQHHERFGGGGYPDSLAGEDIEIGSRILTVADSFDAMTSSRAYRKALDWVIARDELRKGAGGQFDPDLVDVFLKIDAAPTV